MHPRSAALDIELIRTGQLDGAERRAAERAAKRGSLTRIRPGVLVHPETITDLRPADHHVLLIRAALPRIARHTAVGWTSASSLHGLPHFGPWPPKVHLLDPTTTHTIVTASFVRHGCAQRPFGTAESVHGVPVSNVLRTVVDVAATQPLIRSLGAIDHALRHRLVTRSALIEELGRVAPKAHARAQAAIAMGSALSGSPAESLARVRFRQLRTPEPIQQFEFSHPGRQRAVVDFWFPEQGVVVEVDGRAKYEDPDMLAGRSTADAHWREKLREDHIRSFTMVRGFVRLTWADLMDPEVVRVKLTAAGVACG